MIVSAIDKWPDGKMVRTAYDEPNDCPLCKHGIQPVVLARNTFQRESSVTALAVTFLCMHCHQPFLAFYEFTGELTPLGDTTRKIFLEPNRFTPKEFGQKIKDLSPSFQDIYNQALAAESQGLDQIAGIGYRKSLEFLVKDFCVHQFPEEADAIKGKLLKRVISDYIDNPQISTLAEKAAWIGNDETHYVRKHEDRDINDMKKFIQAMVYFVGMLLISEDADSMSPA